MFHPFTLPVQGCIQRSSVSFLWLELQHFSLYHSLSVSRSSYKWQVCCTVAYNVACFFLYISLTSKRGHKHWRIIIFSSNMDTDFIWIHIIFLYYMLFPPLFSIPTFQKLYIIPIVFCYNLCFVSLSNNTLPTQFLCYTPGLQALVNQFCTIVFNFICIDF